MNEKLKTLFDTFEQKHTETQTEFEKMTTEQKAEVLKEKERKAMIIANHNFTIKPLEDQPGAWQVILTIDGKTQNCVFMIDSNNEPPVDEVIKIVELQVKKLILYYVKKNLL